MQRRCFAALASAWALLSGSCGTQALASVPRRDFASLVAGLTGDRRSAARLGASCLAAVDEERLAETCRRLRERRPTQTRELREAIAGLVRDDLARRDMVIVDGWVLARAEAEALALVHLARA